MANVRSYFSKNGGSLGVNGSVDYLFERKGVFQATIPADTDEDDFTLEIIDAGVEEVEFDEHEDDDKQLVIITCPMEEFGSVQNTLEAMKLDITKAGLQRLPMTTVKLDDESFQKVYKMIDALEDDDDVQKVYHNLEATEEQMELV